MGPMGHGHSGEMNMDTKMLIEMIARMSGPERETFIKEMDKRFPNLLDDLGWYIQVTQQERQMELAV
tara:strand:- start:1211 stop:1411 length:201 start_codon:yes stop_codon:yes gene_type:complete